MNAIFCIVLVISLAIFACFNPDGALSAMLSGASKSVTLAINLLAIYSVWSGFLQIAEDSGLIKKLSKLIKPIIKRLFKTEDEVLQGEICANLSANLLGMGGIATPLGISATTKLTDSGNQNGAHLLFILSATSIQILPTTVIALRQSFGSNSPFSIFLPSLLATVVSTATGLLLWRITSVKRMKK